jgi:hypothetical protein
MADGTAKIPLRPANSANSPNSPNPANSTSQSMGSGVENVAG